MTWRHSTHVSGPGQKKAFDKRKRRGDVTRWERSDRLRSGALRAQPELTATGASANASLDALWHADETRQRVMGAAVETPLEVKMCATSESRVAHLADHLSTPDLLSREDVRSVKVGIHRHGLVRVNHHDQVAEAAELVL